MSISSKSLMTWVVWAVLAFCCAACGAGHSTPTLATSALPTLTPVPTPVPGVLFVDATQELGPISPLVYGASYGPWISVPFDLLPEAEAADIAYLRFPGGEWGDQYDPRGYQIDQSTIDV